jgi:hypothetical protein
MALAAVAKKCARFCQFWPGLAQQVHVRIVCQERCLQGVAGPRGAHHAGRDPAQFGVYQSG